MLLGQAGPEKDQGKMWSQEVCVSQPPEEESRALQLDTDAFIQGMCHEGGSACCLSNVLSNRATASCDPSPATMLPSTPCTRWLQIRFQG